MIALNKIKSMIRNAFSLVSVNRDGNGTFIPICGLICMYFLVFEFNLSLSYLLANLLANLLAFTYLHILTLTLFSQNTKNLTHTQTQKRTALLQ